MEEQTQPQKYPEPNTPCPCGSGQTFGVCCLPVLKGERIADTAETLMRARFTAHVVGDFPFVHRTYLPTSKSPYVELQAQPGLVWTRLVVHAHDKGNGQGPSFVEFS